jgi:hypothetical protein
MTHDLAAFARALDQCWLEGRLDDLAQYMAPEVVMVAPGGQHRMVGLASAVESYREFVGRSRVFRFDSSNYVVTEHAGAAVVDYAWEMEWDSGGARHAAKGREVLVLSRLPAGWRVIWRTQIPA